MTGIELTPEAARAALAPLGTMHDVDDAGILERYAFVVWSHVTEPGDGTAGRLIDGLGAVGALRAALRPAADGAGGVSADELAAGRARWMPRMAADVIADALAVAGRVGVGVVTPLDGCWPAQLDALGAHAPRCLWVRGDPGILRRLVPSVAIVGARAATSYGEHVALELAADLAGSGIPIVSGGAYGIDGSAHRAALAVGGITVALLAGGADRAYPAGHAQLLARVAERGAVVSETPCGAAPTKWRFLQRNRLIAALTDATVVVEAGWRSGSLNTAGHAAALSRGLGAVPGPVTSAASAGTHRLLREFGAMCITSAADVRELIGLGAAAQVEHDSRARTDDSTRVRDALSSRTWRRAEDLARRSGMALAEVEAILGLLALDGEAMRGPDGWRAC